MFAFLIQSEAKRRKLWGFDSFAGFPEPTKEDIILQRKGIWDKANRNEVVGLLKNSGITEATFSDINLVSGFLDKTLNKFPDRPIALLHLDVDLL